MSARCSVSACRYVLAVVYTYFFDVTVGPVTYCLVSELSSTRLRAKTVVLARNAYNTCEIIQNIYIPKFLNQDGLNWGAKTVRTLSPNYLITSG